MLRALSHLRGLARVCAITIVASLSLVTTALPANAQITTTSAQSIYRLAPNATFERGCFPPCLCPAWHQGLVRGTFVLSPIPSDTGTITDFRVDDVNWLAQTGNLEWRITGHGFLRRAGGPAVNAQRLELALRINDEPVQHFDSGWVAASANLPAVNLAVTINGGVCFDTRITVIASPVPANQLIPYRTLFGSTFQQGCFDPCDCPLMAPRPLVGSFILVPIPSPTSPTLAINEYAVVNARFGVVSPNAVTSPISVLTIRHHYRGYGFYRRGLRLSTSTTPGQRMFLDLRSTTTNIAGVERFNSGIMPTTEPWPRIDITMSLNGMVCFDKVIHLEAAPHNATGP